MVVEQVVINGLAENQCTCRRGASHPTTGLLDSSLEVHHKFRYHNRGRIPEGERPLPSIRYAPIANIDISMRRKENHSRYQPRAGG